MAQYKGVIERLLEEFEAEQHKGYRTHFTDDRANFNLPPEMKPGPLASIAGKETATTTQERPVTESTKQLRLPGSSTIQSAAYWPTKAYLVVSFKSGHTYSYDEVGPWTIQSWQQASSAGSWFYYNIRTSFKYQKIS